MLKELLVDAESKSGPMVDQRRNTHQNRTRQVDEKRRGVLPTPSYLRLIV